MINLYHNDKLFLFCSVNEADQIRKSADISSYEVLKPDENLASHLDELEPDPNSGVYIIESLSAQTLLDAFAKSFRVRVAAGGLVTNGNGKYLVIYRRGFWDLPKGKIETGETAEEAAVREVEEETGVNSLILGESLIIGQDQQNATYHTFSRKGKVILKKSLWYHMSIKGTQKTTPQVEEDIEIVKWVKKEKLNELLPLCYGSIQDVLRTVLMEE